MQRQREACDTVDTTYASWEIAPAPILLSAKSTDIYLCHTRCCLGHLASHHADCPPCPAPWYAALST